MIDNKDNYETRYDVFNSFLVSNATYYGIEELPVVKSCNKIPNKIITFSEAMKTVNVKVKT